MAEKAYNQILPDGRRTCYFNIPMPPSLNHLWANVYGKGRVRAAKYDEWLTEAGWTIRLAKPYTFSKPVAVDLRIERANKASDLDNRIKAVLDLLQKMNVLENDNLVVMIVARWWKTTGCRVAIVEAYPKLLEESSEAIPTLPGQPVRIAGPEPDDVP